MGDAAEKLTSRQYLNLVEALKIVKKLDGQRCGRLKKDIVRWAEAMGDSVAKQFSHMQWWIEMMSDPEYVPNTADEAIARYAEIRSKLPKERWRNY